MMTERKKETTFLEETPDPVRGLAIGRLIRLGPMGAAQVECDGQAADARTTVLFTENDVGRAVVIAFERGDRRLPIVIGMLREPLEELLMPSASPAPQAEIDGKRVVLDAEHEIVLRCGEASLTLRRDGRVMIRGTHIISRSSGPNRIKGASVDIN